MKRFIALLLIIVCLFSLMGMLTACGGSSETYTCGYCGHKMHGAYWDYINGRYTCRTCSKALRNN